MLQAVLFDFNGVLVDDEPVHCRLVSGLAAERAGLDVTHETYFLRYTGIPDRECFAAVWQDSGLGLSETELDELVAEKARRYRRIAASQNLFFAGATDLLRRVAGQVPIGIVSGALRDEVDLALGRTDLGPLVSVIVTAEDVSRGKPSPEPYLAAMAALGSWARRTGRPVPIAAATLAVEDTVPGVTSARAAGLRVLAVGHTTEPSRLAEADLFVPRVADVDLAEVQRTLSERSTSS